MSILNQYKIFFIKCYSFLSHLLLCVAFEQLALNNIVFYIL